MGEKNILQLKKVTVCPEAVGVCLQQTNAVSASKLQWLRRVSIISLVKCHIFFAPISRGLNRKLAGSVGRSFWTQDGLLAPCPPSDPWTSGCQLQLPVSVTWFHFCHAPLGDRQQV